MPYVIRTPQTRGEGQRETDPRGPNIDTTNLAFHPNCINTQRHIPALLPQLSLVLVADQSWEAAIFSPASVASHLHHRRVTGAPPGGHKRGDSQSEALQLLQAAHHAPACLLLTSITEERLDPLQGNVSTGFASTYFRNESREAIGGAVA